jgi:hypothetical protein
MRCCSMKNISRGAATPLIVRHSTRKANHEAPDLQAPALTEQKRLQDARNRAATRRARVRAMGER